MPPPIVQRRVPRRAAVVETEVEALPVAGDRGHAAAETDVGDAALLELDALDALLELRLLEDRADAAGAGGLDDVLDVEEPHLLGRHADADVVAVVVVLARADRGRADSRSRSGEPAFSSMVGFFGIWQPPVLRLKSVGPATPTSPVATKIDWPCAAPRAYESSSILKNDFGLPHCAQLMVTTGQRLSAVAACSVSTSPCVPSPA